MVHHELGLTLDNWWDAWKWWFEITNHQWAGAGLDDWEQVGTRVPTSAAPVEPPEREDDVRPEKQSPNVAAQVRALREDAPAENDYIDRSMQALGMRQHERIMEYVLCAVGKGARAMADFLTQRGALTGTLVEASRYLGSKLTRTGTFRYERAVRMQAVRAGWHQFGRYWQTRSPFRQRHFLFNGVVQEAALSGLESAGVTGHLTPGEVAPTDRLLARYGPVLLRGTARASEQRGTVVRRAVSNTVIWRRPRLVPAFLWGSIWEGGVGSAHQREAWRAQGGVDGPRGTVRLWGPAHFEDGSPAEHANPWVRQLFADVLSLLFLESVAAPREQEDRTERGESDAMVRGN